MWKYPRTDGEEQEGIPLKFLKDGHEFKTGNATFKYESYKIILKMAIVHKMIIFLKETCCVFQGLSYTWAYYRPHYPFFPYHWPNV